jgi:Xaa-Pro aminopeptidase
MKQALCLRRLLTFRECPHHSVRTTTTRRSLTSLSYLLGMNESRTVSKLPHTSVRWFGQPVAQTHPHLLNEGEVTPKITKTEYRKRRSALVSLARSTFKGINAVDDHIIIFPSANRVYMTNDIPYPFRQHSDFLYACGFQEPSSVLVIHSKKDVPIGSVDNHTAVLFVQQKDAHSELWEGPRSGTKGAVELTGVDSAFSVKELESYLFTFCKDHKNFALWYNYTDAPQSTLHLNVMSKLMVEHRHKHLENSCKLTHELRVRKSQSEIQLMQQTCQIASEAYIDVMKFSRPEVSLVTSTINH